MDILEIIKNRRTIRRYKKEPVPDELMDKIIQAGIWGPSLLASSFQTWKFIVIRDKKIIKSIADIVFNKYKKSGAGLNMILRVAFNIICNAPVIVMVYNTCKFSKAARKIKRSYGNIALRGDRAAISAAIQNMLLVAYSLGIGGCWMDSPLFCEKKINKLLNIDFELVSILSFGFPDEPGKRSPRKPYSESVSYIGRYEG